MASRAARTALSYALFRVAGDAADRWGQPRYCAKVKGATDDAPVTYVHEDGTKTKHGTAHGIRACAWHCLTYTATQGAVLMIGSRAAGVRLRPGAVAAALLISGSTHYIADRRVPGGVLETLATRLGKGEFWGLADHGMNGAFELDQSFHHVWETFAAYVAGR